MAPGAIRVWGLGFRLWGLGFRDYRAIYWGLYRG